MDALDGQESIAVSDVTLVQCSVRLQNSTQIVEIRFRDLARQENGLRIVCDR